MTYLDRINHLWNLRRNGALRSSDHELASFLLDSFNRLAWKNPMVQANALICGLLSISEKTLMDSRNRLKLDGMIDFKPGRKGAPTEYFLLAWEGRKTQNALSYESANEGEFVGANGGANEGPLKSKSKEQEEPKAKAFASGAAATDPSAAVDYPAVIDLFHRLCPSLPRLRDLTDGRRTAIRSRWHAALKARRDPIQRFEELFRLAEESDFLAGRKGRSAFGFDWLIKPANSQKVLEGNYRNDGNLPSRKPKFDTP